MGSGCTPNRLLGIFTACKQSFWMTRLSLLQTWLKVLKFRYQTGALGGTAMGSMGNLYLEDLASDAILKLSPDRKLTKVIQDRRLHWADAPWLQDGYLYLPVAQIDRAPQFNGNVSKIARPLTISRLQMTAGEKNLGKSP